MAVTALIKFTQGMSIGTPGVAMKGVSGTPVFIENVNTTSIQSWKIDLVYVPQPGSSLVVGTLASANSNTPLASFTPDAVPGCYRIQLKVYPGAGFTGTPDVDIRNFAVPDAQGFVYPPYQELPPKIPVTGSGYPGAKPDELNFSGQSFGWDGTGTDGLLLDFMRTMSLGGGGGGPAIWIHNPPVQVGDSPYTAVIMEAVKVDVDTGAIVVQLPDATLYAGQQLKVISLSDAIIPNVCTVDADTLFGQTINGDPTRDLTTPREWVLLESDGSNWLVVG